MKKLFNPKNKLIMELPSNHYESWTNDECEYLKNCYASTSLVALSMALNRTINAIKIKAHNLGLKSGETLKFNKKHDYLKELILSGVHDPKELSIKSGLHRNICNSALMLHLIRPKHINEIKPYILTEQDIIDSIEMKYPPEELKGWELEQYNELIKNKQT